MPEVHISSLIVHMRPESLVDVKGAIERFDNAEIYGEAPQGKLVVVLESANQGFVSDIIEKISQIHNVLSTVLVYHHIENDVDGVSPSTSND